MTNWRRRGEGAAEGAAVGVGGAGAVAGLRTLPKARSLAAHSDQAQRNTWKAAGKKMPPEVGAKLKVGQKAFVRQATMNSALKAPKAGPALAGAAIGAVVLRRKKKVEKRYMDQAEINHRKKVQGISSQVGGTLGLTALGGTMLASRGGRNMMRKVPKLKEHVNAPKPKDHDEDKIKAAVTPLLAGGAGLGGASAFNFAAYTKAEAKQRKRKQPMAKYDLEFPLASEVGIAKRYYDPEEKRLKRAEHYQVGSGVVAGGLAGLAVNQGKKAHGEGLGKLTPVNQHASAGKHMRVTGKGLRHAGKSGALAAAAGGALYAGKKIGEKKRNGNSWDSYH